MTDRDELLSEQPAPDRHEHASVEAAAAWLAAQYDRPTRWRWQSPHGMSAPLPAVTSGRGGDSPPPPPRPVATGMPDPDYRGGAMVPIEYVMAEGSDASGREIVQYVMRRNGHRWAEVLAASPEPAPRIEPTESYVNAPSQPSARESVVLVAFVVLLVASLLWGAAGMPLP